MAEINLDALSNIDLGNGMKDLSHDQIKKIYDQTGSLFWSSDPKPICVIKVDMRYFEPQINVGELWQSIADRMPDYHVFLIHNEIRDDYIDVMELQVFHPKDFTEIQFNELKDLIMADLESIKTPAKNDP
jgi:hypothetical protein